MAVGGWRLVVCGWWLVVGGWRLVVAVVVALRGIRRDPLRHQRREPMGMMCCSLASLH